MGHSKERGVKNPKDLNVLLDFIAATANRFGVAYDTHLELEDGIRTLDILPDWGNGDCDLPAFEAHLMRIVKNTIIHEDPYSRFSNLQIFMNAVEWNSTGKVIGIQGKDALAKTVQSIENYNAGGELKKFVEKLAIDHDFCATVRIDKVEGIHVLCVSPHFPGSESDLKAFHALLKNVFNAEIVLEDPSDVRPMCSVLNKRNMNFYMVLGGADSFLNAVDKVSHYTPLEPAL